MKKLIIFVVSLTAILSAAAQTTPSYLTTSVQVPEVRVNVKNRGALGNSTTGTDGNDDTAAIRLSIHDLCVAGGGKLYFPAGIYRITSNVSVTCAGVTVPPQFSNLYGEPAITIAGESDGNSILMLDNPTEPLLSLHNGVRINLENIALYGQGTATTGTLLENLSTFTSLKNVTLAGTAGIALLQNAERMTLNHVTFYEDRLAWVQGATAGNESYARNIQVLGLGMTMNSLTGTGYYSYDVNAVNGVNPASGAVVQNMHAAIMWNASVNDQIDGCSIKGESDISALRQIGGENNEIAHCYFEGWTGTGPGIGENLSIINGGFDEADASAGALTATTIPTSPTDATAIPVWSVPLTSGIWWRNQLGFTDELNESDGDPSAGAGGGHYTGYIIPPDYLAGSTAASSIGGGIERGYAEAVTYFGVVGNTLYVRSRGTTAYSWPSGAIYVESGGLNKNPSDSLILRDDHFNGYQLKSGYTITADPNCGKPNGAEFENGWMPDCYGYATNRTISSPGAMVLQFSGNTRVRSVSLEVHHRSHILDYGSTYSPGWTNTNANFDIVPLLGDGGIQVKTVTYSDGSVSSSKVFRYSGYADSGYEVGWRDYANATAASTEGQIHQFFGPNYNLCDATATGNMPAYCNVMDAGGIWKRYSVGGTSGSPTYTQNGTYLLTTATQGAINTLTVNAYANYSGANCTIIPGTSGTTPTFAAPSSVTMPGDGSSNGGYVSCVDTYGDIDVYDFRSSGGTAQTVSIAGAPTYFYDGYGNLTTVIGGSLPLKKSVSWTPAAVAASSCAEQTINVGAGSTSQGVRASPPAALSHVWIGSVRISAGATAAVEFCGDATGGTPPSGTWIFEIN